MPNFNWNDAHCGLPHNFVCEADIVVEPTKTFQLNANKVRNYFMPQKKMNCPIELSAIYSGCTASNTIFICFDHF